MLIEQLEGLDYRCYWHRPTYVRMPNFRGNTDNKFPRLVSSNMLCVPRSRNLGVKNMTEAQAPRV